MAGKTRLSSEAIWNGGISATTAVKEREDIVMFTSGLSNVAGELVIQTNIVPPATGNGHMAVVRVTGQVHAASQSIIDLTVRFLAQTGTVSSVSAVNSGSFPIPQVRCMLRTSDNAVAIVITSGAASNLWQFLKVTVDGIFGHALVPDSMLDGWTATLTTDLSALTSVTTSVPVTFADKTVLDALWFKEECRLATTANIDLATGGLLTIDGIATAANNRVLVKNQTAQAENGIYLAQSGPWTRAPDADTTAKCSPIVTLITQGTTQTGQMWKNSFGLGATLGTSVMPFTRVLDTSQIGVAGGAEAFLAAGTASQYLRGDKTWQALAAAAVASTPAGNLSSTTVQAALNELDTEKQATAEKGIANGYASLDGGGKVPIAQLPSSLFTYEGVWNASTNTPTLADGTGDAGQVYRVTTAGSQNLGSGAIAFEVGDYVIYNSSGVWEKSDTTDAVASVAGKTGNVTLVKADVGLANVDNTSDASKPVSTAQQAALDLKQRKAVTGTIGTAISTNAKTVTISGYTPAAGDILELTLTNGNTAAAPTLNVNATGAVVIQQTGPTPAFETSAGGTWLLYYTGTAYVLLNTHDPVDSVFANKINSGQELYARDFITGVAALASQRLSLVYFTCDKVFTATQLRSVSGTTAAAGTLNAKMGLLQVNSDGTLTLLAKTANTTTFWSAANAVYTGALDVSVAMVRNQRYAMGFLWEGVTAPNLSGQAINNGTILTYTPRLLGEVTLQTDIAASYAAPTGGATQRPWGVVLP